MKKFIEVALVLAILLLTGSAALGQEGGPPPTFQTGDVFAGVGSGHINWYRDSGDGIILVKVLNVGATTFDTGMAFDTHGNLYATNFSAGTVSKFDTHGNLLGTFASGLASPESIV